MATSSTKQRLMPSRFLRFTASLTLAVCVQGSVLAHGNAPSELGLQDGFTAWLYGDSLQWRAEPGQRISGELHDGETVIARGATVADATGEYGLGFQPIDPASDAVLRPGRTLVIQPEGDDAVTETVPALLVDVEADRQSIKGSAPPGVIISLDGVREGRLQPIGEPFTSPEDGRISIPIDALDPTRLGFVNATTVRGHTFRAPFAAFSVDIEVGSRTMLGRVSAGTTIEGLVEADGGPRHTIVPREVLTARNWREDVPATLVFDPGVIITLTRTSAALVTPRTMALRVPTLRVAASPKEIYGEGPPDTEVVIEVRAPGQNAVMHRVRTDALGQFRLDVDAERPIEAGWRISAVFDAEAGVRYWTAVPFFPIEVGLYSREIKGVVDVPGAVVRAVLKGADGAIRASGNTTAQRQADRTWPAGQFTMSFAEARIQPGDTIELDWRSGDPILLSVPAFTARVNHETNVVSGEAPPGSRVELATLVSPPEGGIQHANVIILDVDATGRYAYDFSSKHNIQSHEEGHAALITSQGYRFTTRWKPLVLKWNPAIGLSGRGLAGRALRVELISPSGEIVADHEARLGDGAPAWTVIVRDTSGQEVRALPGDRFTVAMGDAGASLDVPELYGVMHVGDDVVTGRTLPRTRVGFYIGNQGGGFYGGETTSNESGVFLHEFGSTFDMLHNATVRISISLPGEHIAETWIDSPGMSVDLDAGIVTGAHEPEIALEGELRRGGVRLAAGAARAAADGDYSLSLFDDMLSGLALMANDVLRILAPTAEMSPELTLRVPEFTMEIEAATRAVSGRVELGGSLTIYPGPAFARTIKVGHDVSGPRVEATVMADGSYHLLFPKPSSGALRPGQRFEGRYVLPDGHIVTRKRVTPIANIQMGGDHVCGFGTPEDEVDVVLRTGSARIATSTGRVAGNSRFDLALRDSDGRPVTIATGQVIAVSIGNQDISLDVPAYKISTGWQVPWESQSVSRTVISGVVPPDSEFVIAYPADDCFTTAAGHSPYTAINGTTSARGMFSGYMGVLPPGTTMQVALFAANGHRYFTRVDRPLGRIHVFSERIDGRAAPFTQLEFQLFGAAGAQKGSAVAEADATGVYHASFTRDGQAVSAMPGDTVELTQLEDALRKAGDVERIAVELLTFDFSERAGLIGRAPANRKVTVRLDLGDKGHRSFERPVDARGSFAYGPADLPPRADWTFADVTSVLLTLPTVDGHEIVADGNVGFVPEPPASAFIPFATRR